MICCTSAVFVIMSVAAAATASILISVLCDIHHLFQLRAIYKQQKTTFSVVNKSYNIRNTLRTTTQLNCYPSMWLISAHTLNMPLRFTWLPTAVRQVHYILRISNAINQTLYYLNRTLEFNRSVAILVAHFSREFCARLLLHQFAAVLHHLVFVAESETL